MSSDVVDLGHNINIFLWYSKDTYGKLGTEINFFIRKSRNVISSTGNIKLCSIDFQK